MASAVIHRRVARCLLSLAAFVPLALSSPSKAGTMSDMEAIHWRVSGLHLIDCKANAFEVIRRLERRGIAARFVVVRTETGGYHAIAVVDGRWALDNRQKDVVTVSQLRAIGYQIARIEGEP